MNKSVFSFNLQSSVARQIVIRHKVNKKILEVNPCSADK